jgi:hypothetical protein
MRAALKKAILAALPFLAGWRWSDRKHECRRPNGTWPFLRSRCHRNGGNHQGVFQQMKEL